MIRKNEKMYILSGGKTEGHICAECSNFRKRIWDRNYYKCQLYSMSYAESSDWAKSWPACAWFNQERPERDLAKVKIKESIERPEIDGQMSIADFIAGGEER